jgi:hypothetical protein
MTFKHIDFSSSEVMRSLEKVALKRGMIAPEPAPPMPAPAPSKNPAEADFTENLLTLCSKLRSQGFHKQANELENKFLFFKQAEAKLYDVSGETGEDVIDFAHSEGGKKLDKDWSDLGTVETITEQHKKITDVIEKMPKGKLAGKNAINAVKIILGQDFNEQELNDNIDRNIQAAEQLWDNIDRIIRDRGNLSYIPGVGRGIDYNVQSRFLKSTFGKKPMTLDAIISLKNRLNHIRDLISPGVTGGVDEDAWYTVSPLFNRFSKFLSVAYADRQKLDDMERKRSEVNSPSETSQPAGGTLQVAPVEVKGLPAPLLPLQEKITSNLEKINSWRAVVSTYQDEADKKTGNNFLNSMASRLNALEVALSKIDAPQADAVVGNFTAQIEELEGKMNKFYDGWIK